MFAPPCNILYVSNRFTGYPLPSPIQPIVPQFLPPPSIQPTLHFLAILYQTAWFGLCQLPLTNYYWNLLLKSDKFISENNFIE